MIARGGTWIGRLAVVIEARFLARKIYIFSFDKSISLYLRHVGLKLLSLNLQLPLIEEGYAPTFFSTVDRSSSRALPPDVSLHMSIFSTTWL